MPGYHRPAGIDGWAAGSLAAVASPPRAADRRFKNRRLPDYHRRFWRTAMGAAEARHDQDPRGHYIPVHKGDLAEALIYDPESAQGERAEEWRDLCRKLGAIFHYQHYLTLERLKEAYFYFNPHHRCTPRGAVAARAAYEALLAALRAVLEEANFVEVPPEEVERAHRTHALVPVEVRAPVEDYADIRFFRRGRHLEEVEADPTVLGFRKEKKQVEVYDDVVLIAAAKPVEEVASRAQRKRLGRPTFHDGRVIIKYFRDIASADLNMLLPNVRVILSLRDKWFLGLPALVGGLPLLLKLAPVLTVLAVLAGIHLGAAGGEVEAGGLRQSIVVLSGLMAVAGFITHQWLKYQRQSLRHQLQITDNLYFRNLNNNAGLFDAVIGAAEEQECKEAFLAFFFLNREPMSRASLDARIERWLRRRFDCDIDFKVEVGLARLDELGLLRRNGETLSVVPLAEALSRLDYHWAAATPAAASAAAAPAAAPAP
jgi:hypothetical protein